MRTKRRQSEPLDIAGIENEIRMGDYPTFAAIAKRFDCTRSRVSQIAKAIGESKKLKKAEAVVEEQLRSPHVAMRPQPFVSWCRQQLRLIGHGWCSFGKHAVPNAEMTIQGAQNPYICKACKIKQRQDRYGRTED